jgi:hypothetical protein
VKVERLESEFDGFAGGASGFGDSEFLEVLRNEGVVPGTGLSVGALQSVARRQLIGSAIAGALVVVVAAVVAMQPMRNDAANAPQHSFPVVQQPSFVTEHFAAEKRGQVETP